MRGKFITIEGGEGAGKSTAIQFIEAYFKKKSLTLITTREPGGTRLGEKVRQLLLDPENTELCHDAELLLMFAARAQHLNQVILPALQQRHWVLSDRFTDASFAYQGAGREMGEQRVAQLEQYVQGDFRPDAVLLLDIEPALGLSRVKLRGESDRFEVENPAFFDRVRQAYLARARQFPGRYHVIDASLTLEEVQAQLQRALQIIVTDS